MKPTVSSSAGWYQPKLLIGLNLWSFNLDLNQLQQWEGSIRQHADTTQFFVNLQHQEIMQPPHSSRYPSSHLNRSDKLHLKREL